MLFIYLVVLTCITSANLFRNGAQRNEPKTSKLILVRIAVTRTRSARFGRLPRNCKQPWIDKQVKVCSPVFSYFELSLGLIINLCQRILNLRPSNVSDVLIFRILHFISICSTKMARVLVGVKRVIDYAVKVMSNDFNLSVNRP